MTNVVSTPAARARRRIFTGTVVAAKMTKTITVAVEQQLRHPKYRKLIRHTKTYHVHDPEGKGKVGAMVSFMECRPISKTKRWRLI